VRHLQNYLPIILSDVLRRADFIDDDEIQEYIQWIHPHISHDDPVEYTEKEKAEMLRLPRKECWYKFRAMAFDSLSLLFSVSISFYRSRYGCSNPRPLSNAGHAPFLLRLRLTNIII